MVGTTATASCLPEMYANSSIKRLPDCRNVLPTQPLYFNRYPQSPNLHSCCLLTSVKAVSSCKMTGPSANISTVNWFQ